MTYKDLAEKISTLTEEQQNQDVTCLVGDDYFPLNSFDVAGETDVLDKDHPYLFFF